MKRWVKSAPHDYKTNPPNALLSYSSTESQDRKNIIIQLLSPKYISDTHELSFIVKSLDDSTPVLSKVMNQPQLMYASPAMCGLLGSWGNLPGEKKYDQACHHAQKDKSIYKKEGFVKISNSKIYYQYSGDGKQLYLLQAFSIH